MCGVVGIFNLSKDHPILEDQVRQMLAIIRHRGPDQFGIYLDEQIGLGSARLSIIDLTTGQQPISNEDDTLWIVFNGEIFNYLELRPELEKRGHHFTTNSDTEVLLHLYEDQGPDCLNLLNGQFAFAIWDKRNQSLFLARDRLGIRPLFYTITNGALIFGSEIKSILCDQRVKAEIDPIALEQIFTYWSTLTPRTAFKDVYEVPPGHYMIASEGEFRIERYWQLHFPVADSAGPTNKSRSKPYLPEILGVFRELLVDATQIRLRADVPVGAYLSGGLDSSTTAAIIRNFTSNRLDTFSITFEDPEFDESEYQLRMAKLLGTDHHIVRANNADIGRVFPEVIWHTETPLMRTSPAPLYLLSKLVRENNYKVVLTGEGADEFLAGYNIFKEAKIRRFWARNPNSTIRPLLLKRLYPYITDLSTGSGAYLKAFFGEGLSEVDSPFYSHTIRWKNTSRTKRFFSEELRQQTAFELHKEHNITLPPEYNRWDVLHKAQYLEISIFLSEYLLSSQGDRMAMAHSVEGRFPFLDPRILEFSNSLSPEIKLNGLDEKYILKQLAKAWLPEEIWKRPKKPYRAPIQDIFFNRFSPDYVQDILSSQYIEQAGFFNSRAVNQMVKKLEVGRRLGETDNMALAGILSTMLVFKQFITDFRIPPPLSIQDEVKVCRGHQQSNQGTQAEYDK